MPGVQSVVLWCLTADQSLAAGDCTTSLIFPHQGGPGRTGGERRGKLLGPIRLGVTPGLTESSPVQCSGGSGMSLHVYHNKLPAWPGLASINFLNISSSTSNILKHLSLSLSLSLIICFNFRVNLAHFLLLPSHANGIAFKQLNFRFYNL